MDCPGCHEPLERDPHRAEWVCSKRHRTMTFIPGPRWTPGHCPDGGDRHQQEPMRLLDSRDERVWWCGEGHYLLANGPKTIDHLSPSALSTAEQCMYRYWNTYVMGRREPTKVPTEVGTFAHEILEHLAQEPDGTRDLDRAKKIAAARWPDYAATWAFQSLRLDPQAVKAFKWQAIRAVECLLHEHPLNGLHVVATEQSFKENLSGTPLHGKIDLTVATDTGGLEVIDYKTGAFPASGLARSLKESGGREKYGRHLELVWKSEREKLKQAHVYVAATRKLHGVEDVTAKLVYCKPGDSGVLIADPADTRMVMHDVRHTWQAIQAHQEAGDFPHNPGPLCGWCPFLAWPNGDGTFEFCPAGVGYARRKMDRPWPWTKRGTDELAPAVVTIRGLDPEQRRIAYAESEQAGYYQEAA